MPPESPNGTPVLSPKVVPWLIALFGLASAGVASFPPHTIAFKICLGISGFGSIFGIVSPGLRK